MGPVLPSIFNHKNWPFDYIPPMYYIYKYYSTAPAQLKASYYSVSVRGILRINLTLLKELMQNMTK